MIQYALKDADGNTFNMSTDTGFDVVARNSLTSSVDNFAWDVRVAERSALEGDVKLGESRIRSREITFDYTRAVGEDSAAYIEDENTLLLWLNKTELLVDVTNNREIKCTVLSFESAYDDGGHKISGSGSFSLLLLNPFWEDISPQNITQTILVIETDIPVTNNGFLDVPFIITITATSACPFFQLSCVETNEGIEVADDIFGTAAFEEMVINMEEGTIVINDLDRRNKITPGTGFFRFPVGSSTLRVDTVTQFDIDVNWYERSFI